MRRLGSQVSMRVARGSAAFQSLGRASLPWKGFLPQPHPAGRMRTSACLLTCAPAGPVEELPGPSLSVVLVAQDVGTAPGPGVSLHLRALAPTLPGAADVGGVGAQRRAAFLGLQAAHRHADPGELRPGPRRERTAQTAEQKPPPKGAHGFRTGRTLSPSTPCFSPAFSCSSFHSWTLEHSPAF